jgi:glutamine phosphoribosylpyrophosphate amidotransferase
MAITFVIVAGSTPTATVQNMCGIVGYVGRAKAMPILLDGLRRLEYRGYDSAGLAIVEKGHLETRKCAGRIAALAKLVRKQPVSGSLGVSHTRKVNLRKRSSTLRCQRQASPGP